MNKITFNDNHLTEALEKREELEKQGYKTCLSYSLGLITGCAKNIVLTYEKK